MYVSFVGVYKHQWQVVRAVARLRKAGFPLKLELVGPPVDRKAIALLAKAISEEDPAGTFVAQNTKTGYREMKDKYRNADLFVFASSCETFGQILTEAMAAGLPIACSQLSAMPEILGDAGAYFNPEDPADIARCLAEMIRDVRTRKTIAMRAYNKAKTYSWKAAAESTFAYLADRATAAQNKAMARL